MSNFRNTEMYVYISKHFHQIHHFSSFNSSAFLQRLQSRGIHETQEQTIHSFCRMRDLMIKTRELALVSPLPGNSPRADIGEIDTRAPFQSVRDAVSLFGDVTSPRGKTAIAKKKAVAAEEGLLEVEAQHGLMVKARLSYMQQLRITEAAKAQAQRELQMAEKTLEQLNIKLQTLMDSKEASVAATGAAKVRAVELEEERAQLDVHRESALDNERELCKSTAAELAACEDELANLRRDYDAVAAERLALIQKAEEAQDELQKKSQLMKEVEQLQEAFDQVKQASLKAEEEYTKLIAEKEELLHGHKLNKERIEKEMKLLEEEHVPTETLQAKLDETMEAIRVLQEQQNDIQSKALHTIRQMTTELDSAKMALEEAVAEENSLRASIDSTTKQLEDVRSEQNRKQKAVSEAESTTEKMQSDLEKSEAELEKAKAGCGFIMQSCVEKLLEDAEIARHEAENSKKSAESLHEEAKATVAVTQEASEKLETALKEAEEAKGVERLAEEQIYCYQGHDDAESNSSGSTRRIKLTVEEYDSVNEKINKSTCNADQEVANAIAQIEAINARDRENSEKLEALLKENEALQSEIKEALKEAEMAEAARRLVETELQKWRQNEHSGAAKAK
ncbi:WEB family protein At1g12150-like [Salvia splendens]|uniref:WEB family protein At1g12150-like n=1 Tax=Salvia splendens TaxID=180675 RepID=UPI001C264A44|nr:WEB family protein At1g12150-like [Salvia splendens]